MKMKKKFELSRNEFEEFIQLAYSRMSLIGQGDKKMLVVKIFIWVFIIMGFAGIIWFHLENEGLNLMRLNLSLVFFGIGLLGIVAFGIYQREYYRHYSLHESGHILKEQTVIITKTGIHFETVNTKQFYLWSAIQTVETSKHLICLYIDNNQALLVPKTIFNSERTEHAFISYINEKLVIPSTFSELPNA